MADPFRSYNFKLTLSDIPDESIHFTKCTGIDMTVENQAYREAGANPITSQIPTQVKYESVTLSYGVTDGRKIWDWLMNAAAGKVERKHAEIVHLGSDDAKELERWTLVDAWPQNWQGSELDAAGNQVAIASLTLVFNGLKRN